MDHTFSFSNDIQQPVFHATYKKLLDKGLEKVLVVVNKDIFIVYRDVITKWFTSMEYQGYDLMINITEWIKDPFDFKAYLKKLYDDFNLSGVIIIGPNKLQRSAEIEFPDYDEPPYPMDLWFTDFDGEYLDTDEDGRIDTIKGGALISPEIFLARITTTFGDDTVEIVLNKSLRILTGEIPVMRNASLFIDDDWEYYDYEIKDWFSSVYNPITVVSDPTITKHDKFFNLLSESWGLFYQAIHSSPTTLYIAEGDNYYMVPSNIIASSNYKGGQLTILFSCSAANYWTQYYLAEAYLRLKNTIVATSSTKIGGFWYGNYLTEKLAQNLSVGDSFKYWFSNIISNYYNGINPDYNPPWWLGMTIIGDPLLSFNLTTIDPVDTDNDSIFDTVEYMYGTNPNSNDTDGDGILDSMEVIYGLNPLNNNDANQDFDGDGVLNIDEIELLMNIFDSDTDNDGLPDGWEYSQGTDPVYRDSSKDYDNDGLTNIAEYQYGTDPKNPDSDNDNMPDGWEVNYGLDPLSNDASLDPDEDGLSNLGEFQCGTNPVASDTDGDGIPDGWEINYGLDPLLNDSEEDIDGDGANNLMEYMYGTDPTNSDTDGDGVDDYTEIKYASNPLDPENYPIFIKYWYLFVASAVLIVLGIVMIIRRKKAH